MDDDDPLSLPGPITEPKGPRWLAWVPPPIGEWFYTGGVSGPPSWTLHCPPIFMARVIAEGGKPGARLHCQLNNNNLGHFQKLEAAQQRAEWEMICLFRATLPALATIRRLYRSKPKVEDPPPPEAKRRIAKAYQPVPDPADFWKCKCGFTCRDRQVWQVTGDYGRSAFYCADCIPPELLKEIEELMPKPVVVARDPVRCECGAIATYLRGDKPICDKCFDPRDSRPE